ncbi:P-II family nitrogen regulator [Cellulosilyticum sp. ST5]|uniref:P-II family nitrogen regulator n=1 Tax=Cellulosilyticum sp. ST5 TaxID=3055805 RepID=UPI003977625A
MNKQMRAVFTIVDYSRGKQIADIYINEQIPIRIVTHGHGMADSVILDYLGLGENKKSIMISLLSPERTKRIFSILEEKMYIKKPGKGIAFSVPVSSMTSFLSSIVEADSTKNTELIKEDELNMADGYQHELIISIITKGHFPEVKAAASAAGAKGGTLIHALGLGGEEAQKFLGISIQPEKDVILIVVRKDEKNKVMKAIAEAAGINTEGRGISFSLPVDCALGLSETAIPQFNTEETVE